MKLQDVISKATAKKISWLEAAEIAGVTDRTVRRMRERYRELGYSGLFDQRRRKRSIPRVPMCCACRRTTTRVTFNCCACRSGRSRDLNLAATSSASPTRIVGFSSPL